MPPSTVQGNLLNGPNRLNGRGYFDSRGFLIRGGHGIAVENDFAAGSGPARQARARLHAVVDPEPDRRIALVWAARNEGGLSSWAEPEPASKGGTRLYTRGPRLTETLRVIDAQALADVLGALFLEEGGNARHIAIDGKTMRASKDSEGKAEHVLSAFCSSLQTVLGHEASRSKGLEIPDALKLLERLDLRGKIVTGDAIFCQKSIAAKIVERGGDYVFPVKDNQKTLRQDIETAFNEPVFPPVLME